MLPGSSFGDDPPFAHTACQQDLAQHVVHFVRAGVVELVALEVDLCTARAAVGGRHGAQVFSHALGEIERAWPADVMREVIIHVALERRIDLRGRIGLLELEDQRHQRFGHETPAEQSEMSALVGTGAE